MQRHVQVWQMVDGFGNPLGGRFPGKGLVDLVNAASDRRAHCADGTELLLEAFSASRGHVCLYRVRRDNLPSEERAGTVRDLSIPTSSGLAEGTHIVFYPRNVVLVIYNHEGPRIARMSEWISQRTGLDIQFVPVRRADVADVIKEMVRFNAIELSLTADQAAALLADDVDGESLDDGGIAEALYAASQLTHYGNITLGLSVGAGKPGPSKELAFKRLIDRVRGRKDLGHFRRARVTGVLPGGRGTTVVDLIEDRLVAHREIDPEDSRFRRISSDSAFAAAQDTYESFKEQISKVIDRVPEQRISLPDSLLPPSSPRVAADDDSEE